VIMSEIEQEERQTYFQNRSREAGFNSLWAPIPRMIEFIFNGGRDGWTEDMVEKFQRLSWRYCILMEEHLGTQACVINLHSLTHFSEDIVKVFCSRQLLVHTV